MNVTLSIRTSAYPPFTRDRARLLAKAFLPKVGRVLVSAGNKTFLVFRSSGELSCEPAVRDRGMMTVTLSMRTKIGARVHLTKYRVLVLVRKHMPKRDIVRIEGGKYTYLAVLEDGERSVYRLGTCRMCGRDTLGCNEYCRGCLPTKLKGDDVYYSLEKCCEFLSYWVGIADRRVVDGIVENFGL